MSDADDTGWPARPEPGPAYPAPRAVPEAGGSAPEPPAPEPLLVRVQPWPDPLLDRFGHDPRTPYVERFWLPILGPSGTLLLRRLAAGFDDHPTGYLVDLTDVARGLGMGRREGPSAGFHRTLDRVVSFGFAQPVDDRTLAIRRRLPALTRRQLQRLPRSLRDDHEHWVGDAPAAASLDERVHRLARSLLDLGEDPASVERHLVRLGFDVVVVRRALDAAGADDDREARGDDAA
jgi:hypothetical protein